MKTSPTKKAAAPQQNRKKLLKDNFEWTEEAILAVHETSNPHSESKSPTASAAPALRTLTKNDLDAKSKAKPPPPQPMGRNVVSSGLYVDTMEAKIERVQQRKREEAMRAARRAALPPQPVPTNHELGEFQMQQLEHIKDAQGKSAAAAAFLNGYIERFVAERPHLLEGVVATFPLHLFDDSTFDELLPVPAAAGAEVDEEIAFASLPAVCLVSPFVLAGAADDDAVGLGLEGLTLDDLSQRARGAGTWYPCKVVKVLPPPPPSLSWEELGAGKHTGLQFVVRVAAGDGASGSGETKGDGEGGVSEEKHAGSLTGRVFTVSSLHVHFLRPPRAGPPSPSKLPKGLRAVAAPAGVPAAPPLQVYGDRVVQALERRAACVGLVKYTYYVHNVPYNEGARRGCGKGGC